MTWTDIPAIATDDILTVGTMQDVWGNLYHLKDRMYKDNQLASGGTTWTTTSSVFSDINITGGYRQEFETDGNDFLVIVPLPYSFQATNNGAAKFTLELDGSAYGNANGLARLQTWGAEGNPELYQMLHIFTGIDAGDHTLDVQWGVVSAGTALGSAALPESMAAFRVSVISF